MSAIALSEYERDEGLQALLARHREAALREVMAANRPRLLEVVKAIQPAALKAIDAEEK